MTEKTAKKQSLSSIARELGVSTALVSNVMRSTSSTTLAGGATKQKILDAAWRNGLQLNNNIGVVLPREVREHEAIFYPGFAGISERCAQLGFGTFQAAYSDDNAIPSFLKQREVSGVIFWNEVPASMLNFVLNEKIPFVLLNPSDDSTEYDAALFNDYETMAELFEYLYCKNYRKYIFVLHDIKNGFTERSRKAFNDFLSKRSVDGKNIFDLKECEEGLIPEFENEVGCADSRTVFITLSRFATIKVLESLAAHRKRIPEDTGLVGSNVIGDYYAPKLTSVVNPFYEMGAAAVDMMAEKWSSRKFQLGCHRVLKGIIVKNPSTGGE